MTKQDRLLCADVGASGVHIAVAPKRCRSCMRETLGHPRTPGLFHRCPSAGGRECGQPTGRELGNSSDYVSVCAAGRAQAQSIVKFMRSMLACTVGIGWVGGRGSLQIARRSSEVLGLRELPSLSLRRAVMAASGGRSLTGIQMNMRRRVAAGPRLPAPMPDPSPSRCATLAGGKGAQR